MFEHGEQQHHLFDLFNLMFVAILSLKYFPIFFTWILWIRFYSVQVQLNAYKQETVRIIASIRYSKKLSFALLFAICVLGTLNPMTKFGNNELKHDADEDDNMNCDTDRALCIIWEVTEYLNSIIYIVIVITIFTIMWRANTKLSEFLQLQKDFSYPIKLIKANLLLMLIVNFSHNFYLIIELIITKEKQIYQAKNGIVILLDYASSLQQQLILVFQTLFFYYLADAQLRDYDQPCAVSFNEDLIEEINNISNSMDKSSVQMGANFTL